jgi:hypothetical protein
MYFKLFLAIYQVRILIIGELHKKQI